MLEANRRGGSAPSPEGDEIAAPEPAYARAMTLAWPIRSVLSGTTTMTLAYAAERRLRRGERGPLDHDDLLVPARPSRA